MFKLILSKLLPSSPANNQENNLTLRFIRKGRYNFQKLLAISGHKKASD